MSIQRRRVLEGSKLIDGVYIEGLDGKAYAVDDWQGGNDANSIIVVSGDVKFRMAVTGGLIYDSYYVEANLSIGLDNDDPIEKYMTAIRSETEAKADYNGSVNTANIMKVQPSTGYAAGYCSAFVFPDGKTKGFLPSLGQLNLAYQNKAAVDAALSACGGTAMGAPDSYYWSSTFWGIFQRKYRECWYLNWSTGEAGYYAINYEYCVRPFADIS